jgi:hypothetical protein
MTWSPQKTLAHLFFALVVAGVALDQPTTDQEALATKKAHDPPQCENIN